MTSKCAKLAGATLAAVLLTATISCAPKNQFAPPPPPQVTVANPVEREVDEALEFTGWTEATAAVDLRARVGGYLEKVAFQDGGQVAAGDLLFVIEQAPYQLARDAAAANVQKAQAALQLAQSQYNRAVPLEQRAAITRAELDIQAAELASAKANLATADAALRQAELDLSYTEIRAPVSGVIGRRLVDPGNLVTAGETLLARVENIAPIYAYFSVSESDLLRAMEALRRRDGGLDAMRSDPPKLYLGLANEADFPHEGRFDFADRTLDRRTGTALRRGLFDNADLALVPGMFVRINAPLGEPKPRLLVEERAVGVDQQGTYLLVVNDKNVVEYRPVKLGAVHDGMRVVASGASKDDWVIVNGLQRARPGATVNPQRPGETQPAATATALTPPPR